MSNRSVEAASLHQQAVSRPNTASHTKGPSVGARQAFQSSLNRAADKPTTELSSARHAPANKLTGTPTGTLSNNLKVPPSESEPENDEPVSQVPLEAEASETTTLADLPQSLLACRELTGQLENHGTVLSAHWLQQPAVMATASMAISAHTLATSGEAISGLLTCDSLAAMLDRVGAVEHASGLHSFELVDSALGLKSVQIGTDGSAAWTIRLLTDRVSREQFRRQSSDLHTALSERGYRVASIAVVGLTDTERHST